MVKALVQRYDNKEDIYAIEKFGCSDFPYRSADDQFDILIVVPTLRAKTSLALIADTTSAQYEPKKRLFWPSRKNRYRIRVDVKNIKYTDLDTVRGELEHAGLEFSEHWHIKTLCIEENNL